MTLIETAVAGIPVSTTHTITGAIMGVGSLYRFCAVRWGVAKRIIWAWILTIPASGGVAALAWYLSRAPVLGRENVLIGQRQGLAWVRDPLDRGLDARDYGLGERSVKIGPQLLSIAESPGA
jgi:hypothetical protein